MKKAPVFWIQHVEEALSLLCDIPLWGTSPPFPWDKCSLQIATLLELPELQITHKTTSLLPPEQLQLGLGTRPIDVTIELSPLVGAAHWLMSAEDVAQLSQLLLTENVSIKGFSSPSFQEGFYRYLILQSIAQIDQLHPFNDLSLKWGAPHPLPTQEALCIDIAISHAKLNMWGRLVCPSGFHHAFKNHFSLHPPSIFDLPITQHLDLPIKLEIGHTTLNYSQWETLSEGDFLILDRCTYDPTTRKGSATMTLKQKPLFRTKIKESNIKIVEYAFYYEDQQMMDDHNTHEENEDPILPDESVSHVDDDEVLEEEDPILPDESTSHIDDDEVLEETDENAQLPEHETQSVEELIKADAIPLTISVEIAQIKMNLEKLLQLQPGNLIELPSRPEQGVNLTINGKCVAQGELVKLGDILGVKILKIKN